MNGENSVKCKRNLGVYVCLSGQCVCVCVCVCVCMSIERGRGVADK